MKKAFLCAALSAVLLLAGCGPAAPAQGTAESASAASTQATAAPAGPDAAPTEWRAMWVSYLEWKNVDFSTEAAYTAEMEQLLDNCAALGLNTVIAQVRPFGDALYPSELYPWSYLCTGTAGQAPGFDPLAILVEQAHARGLEVEGWINPYRIRLNAETPAGELAPDSPAILHPEWVKQVADGLWLDPANSEVQAYIVAGVQELLQNYALDGIQFDDYFYPTTDENFDAETFAASGSALGLDDWRRQNVDTLIRATYKAIKAENPAVRFGISPQGNPDNNYNGQYSDVSLWMRTAGYLDYVAPQLYWGYGYTTQGGSTRYAYENICAEWAQMDRLDSVALYVGLGAYRIGEGDGGSDDAQWQTGHALADMVATARQNGVQGYALYRYDFLYRNDAWPELAAQEVAGLTETNAE